MSQKFTSGDGKRKAPKVVKKAKRISEKSKRDKGVKLSPGRKIALVIAITLGIIALVALIAFIVHQFIVVPPERPDNIDTPERPTISGAPIVSKLPDDPKTATSDDYKDGYYTILLMGHNDGLTDVMIVVGFDSANKVINMLSIPRDTYSNVSNRTDKKINGAYNTGRYGKDKTNEDGMELVMDEVEMLVGFRPDYYVMIDYDGVVELVDLLQGIEVNIPKPNNPNYKGTRLYHRDDNGKVDINLDPGLQTLNGYQALGLARFRAGYADQDLTRIKNVQNILAACAKKAIKTLSFSKIGEYARIFNEYVFTDLPILNMVWFAEQMWGMDMETSMHGFTPQYYSTMVGGISYLFLYEQDMADLVNATVNPFKFEITVEDMNIYNPTGKSASGGNVTSSTTGSATQTPAASGSSSTGSSSGGTTASSSKTTKAPSSGTTTIAAPSATPPVSKPPASTQTAGTEAPPDDDAPSVSSEPDDEDGTPTPPPDDDEFYDEEIIYTPEPEFIPAGVE